MYKLKKAEESNTWSFQQWKDKVLKQYPNALVLTYKNNRPCIESEVEVAFGYETSLKDYFVGEWSAKWSVVYEKIQGEEN